MTTVLGLGIDAGGTYTDAVLVELDSGRVVNWAKALTTKPDPSEGISRALDQLDQSYMSRVGLVSLATTFATNAMVEGTGAEAGLILIGYDEPPAAIPNDTRLLILGGGHKVSGEEKAPLDESGLKERLDSFLQDLDGVAIAGFFSVRNPDHEWRVARAILHGHDMPVVMGHRLSMRLNANKRATTAWWNARLIPLIRRLIKSAAQVIAKRGIKAL